jgi:glycosyltransferase involved in cell wall biosynthesis
LSCLRHQDEKSAQHVHTFLANSSYVADRISRSYGRESTVIYPPVDVDYFSSSEGPKTHYLAGGRMVGYKRIERAIQAANREGFPLMVFGDGPDMGRLSKLGGPTVNFVGSVSPAQLSDLIQLSRAFLFPGVEDFGILPVEVQAGGCPVIALAEGGAVETVRHGETGLLYEDDSVEGLLDAIHQFETMTFDPRTCLDNVRRFSRARFENEMVGIIRRIVSEV